jgi:hypothetical protein
MAELVKQPVRLVVKDRGLWKRLKGAWREPLTQVRILDGLSLSFAEER